MSINASETVLWEVTTADGRHVSATLVSQGHALILVVHVDGAIDDVALESLRLEK